ncbi:T9SS type A sorting domain-containing protein [Pseudalgibacter alginicilyticus]|nr:T9SS type A sorting domain-containing protein [Pseudalgibacter alginicilyticus]
MNTTFTLKKQSLFLLVLLLGITYNYAQTDLPYFTDFEDNAGGWIDGGNDSKYVTNNNSSPEGNNSWEIKDDSGEASSFYQKFNLLNYTSVTISFSFESDGFDNNQDRFEVKLDGNRLERYKYKDYWNQNGRKQIATFTLNSTDYTFKSNSEITFESDSDNADKLYIDEISITGIKPIPCTTDAITLPWNEGFETANINEYTNNSSDLNGLCGWDYEKTRNGRLRFNVEEHTGSKAAFFDSNRDDRYSENYLIKTLNLSNYIDATDLELSFWFADYGDENHDNDAVWIRGNNTATWIKVYTINPENVTNNTWNEITNIDIDQLLNDAGQTVSSTFQIKLGQYDNYSQNYDGIAYDDIEITGTQYAIWRNGAWVNGIQPTLSIKTLIDDSYNTSTEGSFSCKTLNINTPYILTVDNNTYIEVENDVIVNGQIIVETQGSFVQNNNNGTIINNGLMSVNKETALMNQWYEYTYWSSPVSGETIGSGLLKSNTNRRFKFIAQNFIDAKAEVGNNNAKDAGQDDIDDDGNDWAWVSGTTIMTPGVGYASTSNQSIFNNTPGTSKRIAYTFEGTFNNGIYSLPIYRNDTELKDNNWNFIGNPYPSAIDADLFLAANSNISTDITSTKSLSGAIYLWSQNTPPSGTTNGNEQLNFSNDDYAIINFLGQIAGGDGIKPSRYIPSGQGFFVSMDNAASATSLSDNVYSSNVIFNNSMRVKGPTENSQFFKSSNVKEKSTNTEINKLWLNLSSDNGVYNQILVGYINGATNNDDGAAYDATKYPTSGAALYSTITGSNQKYAIQSKAVNNMNKDEVISLGFSTTINAATLYKLSIDDIEGDFLTDNAIYLKDNLLNKTHNLSDSDYTFTSETGEFNNRFEIVFNTNTLSINTTTTNQTDLSIVEFQNNQVQFSVFNNLNIESVSIFNLLGKQLYQFKGGNSKETYNLSKLNNIVYIAKVTLSNGAVIIKKAVKK